MDRAVTLRLATGPVSWGVDFAGAPGNPPWAEVLDGIARAGYEWTELGPLGYLPEGADELRARGLRACGSFVFEPLHDRGRLDRVLATARRTCRAISAAGGRHLVVIDLVAPDRAATAGRPRDARRLEPREWDALVAAVHAVCTVARAGFGLVPVIHPHAGSHVEFADEIERLLAALPPELAGLCLDTGHCAYAGLDPVELYLRHADRVSYLHLKDVDPAVRERAVAERLGFWEAIEAGIFCPLGAGCVDFRALGRALERHGFDGWATVEQDRKPGTGDPLADAIASRRHLEAAGLAGARAGAA
jgi:inosose dehydratase